MTKIVYSRISGFDRFNKSKISNLKWLQISSRSFPFKQDSLKVFTLLVVLSPHLLKLKSKHHENLILIQRVDEVDGLKWTVLKIPRLLLQREVYKWNTSTMISILKRPNKMTKGLRPLMKISERLWKRLLKSHLLKNLLSLSSESEKKPTKYWRIAAPTWWASRWESSATRKWRNKLIVPICPRKTAWGRNYRWRSSRR
jgi:hypothetical protein